MNLQDCVASVVQGSFLSYDITPRISSLLESLGVLALVEDTASIAHVGHNVQTGLQLFKTEVL